MRISKLFDRTCRPIAVALAGTLVAGSFLTAGCGSGIGRQPSPSDTSLQTARSGLSMLTIVGGAGTSDGIKTIAVPTNTQMLVLQTGNGSAPPPTSGQLSFELTPPSGTDAIARMDNGAVQLHGLTPLPDTTALAQSVEAAFGALQSEAMPAPGATEDEVTAAASRLVGQPIPEALRDQVAQFWAEMPVNCGGESPGRASQGVQEAAGCIVILKPEPGQWIIRWQSQKRSEGFHAQVVVVPQSGIELSELSELLEGSAAVPSSRGLWRGAVPWVVCTLKIVWALHGFYVFIAALVGNPVASTVAAAAWYVVRQVGRSVSVDLAFIVIERWLRSRAALSMASPSTPSVASTPRRMLMAA